jgi:hypothetical protein
MFIRWTIFLVGWKLFILFFFNCSFLNDHVTMILQRIILYLYVVVFKKITTIVTPLQSLKEILSILTITLQLQCDCCPNLLHFRLWYCNPMCPCNCKYLPLHVQLNNGSNQLFVKYVVAWYNYKSFRSKCRWNFDIFCSFSLIYPLMDDNLSCMVTITIMFYNYGQYQFKLAYMAHMAFP